MKPSVNFHMKLFKVFPFCLGRTQKEVLTWSSDGTSFEPIWAIKDTILEICWSGFEEVLPPIILNLFGILIAGRKNSVLCDFRNWSAQKWCWAIELARIFRGENVSVLESGTVVDLKIAAQQTVLGARLPETCCTWVTWWMSFRCRSTFWASKWRQPCRYCTAAKDSCNVSRVCFVGCWRWYDCHMGPSRPWW